MLERPQLNLCSAYALSALAYHTLTRSWHTQRATASLVTTLTAGGDIKRTALPNVCHKQLIMCAAGLGAKP